MPHNALYGKSGASDGWLLRRLRSYNQNELLARKKLRGEGVDLIRFATSEKDSFDQLNFHWYARQISYTNPNTLHIRRQSGGR